MKIPLCNESDYIDTGRVEAVRGCSLSLAGIATRTLHVAQFGKTEPCGEKTVIWQRTSGFVMCAALCNLNTNGTLGICTWKFRS